MSWVMQKNQLATEITYLRTSYFHHCDLIWVLPDDSGSIQTLLILSVTKQVFRRDQEGTEAHSVMHCAADPTPGKTRSLDPRWRTEKLRWANPPAPQNPQARAHGEQLPRRDALGLVSLPSAPAVTREVWSWTDFWGRCLWDNVCFFFFFHA